MPEVKKKTRGGKKYKLQKEIKELRRLIPISSGQQKYQFYLRLKELTTKETKPTNSKPEIVINENIKQNNNNGDNMVFNLKLDMLFFIILGILIFAIYKVNKYFKDYVAKKQQLLFNKNKK